MSDKIKAAEEALELINKELDWLAQVSTSKIKYHPSHIAQSASNIRAALEILLEDNRDCGWLCVSCGVWWGAPARAQQQGCPKCKAKATCMGEDDSAEFLGSIDSPYASSVGPLKSQALKATPCERCGILERELLERDLGGQGRLVTFLGENIDYWLKLREASLRPDKAVDPEMLKIKDHAMMSMAESIWYPADWNDCVDDITTRYELKEPETIAVFEFMGEKINVTRENSAFVRVVKDFIESTLNPKSESK